MFGETIDKILKHQQQLMSSQCSTVKFAAQAHQLMGRRNAEAAAFLLSSRVIEHTCLVDDIHRQLRDVRKVVQASELSGTENIRAQRDVLLGTEELIAVAASIRTQLQTIDRQLNSAV